ncbi:MAG: uroporphyrinogen decarboxylase family protein [Patescibacteria group bacterium]
MNSRERLLSVFQGRTPDRIPWAPLIDGYYLSSLPHPTNPVDAVREFGGDVLERHVPTYREITNDIKRIPVNLAITKHETESGHASVRTVGRIGEIEIITCETCGRGERTITTPVGTLHEAWLRTKTSPFIPFLTEHKIKSFHDLKTYHYLVEHMEYVPTYEIFSQEDAYVGPSGLATTSSPCTPLQNLLEIEIGMEHFYYMLADYPNEMNELMGLMHERNKEIYEIIALSPAQVVIDHENTSTTLMSPMIYEQYCERQLDEYAGILHSKGKIFLTHMCGTLKRLEAQLRRGQMDGIIDIAPPATGDVDLADAKQMWGPDKVVMGGIDATVFVGSTPEEIAAYARDLLRRIAPGDRVILGSGDATPQGTPVRNMAAVTEVVRAAGGYPLPE